MLRRLATALLVLAVALGGLSTAACASGQCAMKQQRMRCCEPGLHGDRSCCGGGAQRAGAPAPATLERTGHTAPPLALTLLPVAIATAPIGRGHVAAAPRRISHAPPPTLIAQHTSLLL